MKRLLVYLLTGLFLFSSAQAQESLRSAPLYAALNQQAANSGFNGIMAVAEQKRSAEERAVLLQWLKDRVWEKSDPDPFYALGYSDMLYTTASAYEGTAHAKETAGLYQTAYLSLRLFEAMALTDAARCADPSVPAALTELLAKRYKYFEPLLPSFPESAWRIFKEVPLAQEEKLAARPENPVICRSGLEAVNHSAQDPNSAKQQVQDNAMIGGSKTVITPGAPYQPQFIAANAWQEKRKALRAALAARWDQRR